MVSFFKIFKLFSLSVAIVFLILIITCCNRLYIKLYKIINHLRSHFYSLFTNKPLFVPYSCYYKDAMISYTGKTNTFKLRWYTSCSLFKFK